MERDGQRQSHRNMERDTDGDEGRKAGTETLEERHDESGMGQERQAGAGPGLELPGPSWPQQLSVSGSVVAAR